MGLITPDYGLLFWMLLSFGLLVFILKKFAWKAILDIIKSRENFVSKSLHEAEFARSEIANLEEKKAQVIAKTQVERNEILTRANKTGESIILESKAKAEKEAQNIIAKANLTITREKEAAQLELKRYASAIILQTTERILRSELKGKENFEQQVSAIINELSAQN